MELAAALSYYTLLSLAPLVLMAVGVAGLVFERTAVEEKLVAEMHDLVGAAGAEVRDLAGLYRKVWSLGAAGLEIPMSIYRDGKTIETRVKSGDRTRFLKAPKLH